jgi:hypothetical protein
MFALHTKATPPGCGEADIEEPGIHLSPICLELSILLRGCGSFKCSFARILQGPGRAAIHVSTLAPNLLHRTDFDSNPYELILPRR